MCGRYAMFLRFSQVRAYFEEEEMPVWDAPEDDADDAPRQSYNFAPGYYGMVYRADVPDWGAGPRSHKKGDGEGKDDEETESEPTFEATAESADKQVKYKLQSMKWGLVPFWTKRNPDYASMLKTINCRDDSLLESRGMWNTMKQKKRCIVIAQGFYEWLKKPNSKEKVAHYTKRADGKVLCMAGLWDCVQYEGSPEKLYTYTIITTDSNKQLSFLHDRMPVILDNGSEDIRTWLDPKRHTWSRELQALLKPYQGQLECYPVSKEVGKVGNNSPTFIVPVDSKENKNNIANFFANAKSPKAKTGTKVESKSESASTTKKEDEEPAMKKEPFENVEEDENRDTIDHSGTEDNAPLPVPKFAQGTKRSHVDDVPEGSESPPKKAAKISESPMKKQISPVKGGRKMKSATSNGTASPAKNTSAGKDRGNQRITNFFSK